jgi:hypothetical protein
MGKQPVYPSDRIAGGFSGENRPKVRFSATVGEKPEVEVAHVWRFPLACCTRN